MRSTSKPTSLSLTTLGAGLALLAACGAPPAAPPPPPPPPPAAPEPPPPPPEPEATPSAEAAPAAPTSTLPPPSGRPPLVISGGEKISDTFGASPAAKLELGKEGAFLRIPEYALGDGMLITFALDKKGKKHKGAVGALYKLMGQVPPSEDARTVSSKGPAFLLRLPDGGASPANLAIGETAKDAAGKESFTWRVVAGKATEPGFVTFELTEFTNASLHITKEAPTP